MGAAITCWLSFTAINPCDNSTVQCSHLCLLSSSAAQGYSCACPGELVLDETGQTCERKEVLIVCKQKLSQSMYFQSLVPEYLVIADTNNRYIRRINTDGSGYATISYRGSYRPYAIDFDFRYDLISIWLNFHKVLYVINFLRLILGGTTSSGVRCTRPTKEYIVLI